MKDIIYKNEIILANRLTTDVSDYICHDFIEYCSNGQVASYKDIVSHYKNCEPRNYTITEFSILCLSNTIIQAKYISEYCGELSRRSSLWRMENDKWKMFFHQGTPCK